MTTQLTDKYNYYIIVAHTMPEFGIGLSGTIPWYIPEDLKHFKNITSSNNPNNSLTVVDNCNENKLNICVMGRKTYDSIPVHIKPLSNRYTIIVSSNEEKNNYNNSNYNNNELWTTWDNLNNALDNLYNPDNVSGNVFFCGGEQIYKLALDTYPITSSYVTEIYYNTKACMTDFDTFFPKYKLQEWYPSYYLKSENKHNPEYINNSMLHLATVSEFKSYYDKRKSRVYYYRFKTYYNNYNLQKNKLTPWVNTSPEQLQYLNVMKQIMTEGIERDDRTGTGTLSIFGTRQHYNLRDTFPLSTTKRIFFRAVFEELKLYLSGKTDNKILQNKDIHIWDGNTSREFLNSRSLQHYPEGDMGETYGFNFRHFAGNYKDCHTEYPLDGSNGYDQLENVIHLLKTDPTSRRIIINLWNPATLHKAALPSCLMMYQFYVDTHAKLLHCQIYIRSSDYFLANNWNTCTGALLVHMLCALEDINLTPGSITTITGDTHLYKTHLEQVNINLERRPVPFPKLVIDNMDSNNGKFKTITDIEFDDLQLWGYNPLPNISAPMAV